MLRRTHTDYDFSGDYLNRHILGLVKAKYLYAPDSPGSQSIQTLMNKTTFAYDVDSGICTGICLDYATAASGGSVIQHDGSSFGSSFVTGRGMLTKIQRWDVTDELNSSKVVTSSMRYNVQGSVIRTSDPLAHFTTISYGDDFSNDGTTSDPSHSLTMAYPTKVTNADGFFSKAKYSYYHGSVTRREDPKGAAITTVYDSAARVKQITNQVNSAYTRFVYPTSDVIINTFTTINDSTESYSAKVFDGAGRLRATAGDFLDSAGNHYRGQYASYDVLGRGISQSNPTEMTNTWVKTGADAGWYVTTQTLDWKGRPVLVTNPDNTTREVSYTGCGCAGGEIVTFTDEGSDIGTPSSPLIKKRQQKVYSDVFGRTVKTEVFNWDGAGSYGTGSGATVRSTTVNTYNARDRLVSILRYSGPVSSGIYQESAFTYDGYGRLKTKHEPMEQVDPNNSASTDKRTWTYNTDDTVQKITDARGAVANFSYNARRLLTGITYSLVSGVPTSGPSAVLATASATFDYDGAGNRTSMTDGGGSITYHYDDLSRMDWEERTFTGLSGAYRLTYQYNLTGAVKSVADQVGGTTYTTAFDAIGRVTSVSAS
jgi:YD repeat-containing protein